MKAAACHRWSEVYTYGLVNIVITLKPSSLSSLATYGRKHEYWHAVRRYEARDRSKLTAVAERMR